MSNPAETVSHWEELAACRGRDPRLWFPARGDYFSIQVAKAICRRCPVRRQCLDTALEGFDGWPMVGIWGGTSENQRIKLRRARRVS